MGIARACVLQSQQPPGPLSCGERPLLSAGAPQPGQAQTPSVRPAALGKGPPAAGGRAGGREGSGAVLAGHGGAGGTHRVAGHGAGTREEPCGEQAALTAPGPARAPRPPRDQPCPLPTGRCPVPAAPHSVRSWDTLASRCPIPASSTSRCPVPVPAPPRPAAVPVPAPTSCRPAPCCAGSPPCLRMAGGHPRL